MYLLMLILSLAVSSAQAKQFSYFRDSSKVSDSIFFSRESLSHSYAKGTNVTHGCFLVMTNVAEDVQSSAYDLGLSAAPYVVSEKLKPVARMVRYATNNLPALIEVEHHPLIKVVGQCITLDDLDLMALHAATSFIARKERETPYTTSLAGATLEALAAVAIKKTAAGIYYVAEQCDMHEYIDAIPFTAKASGYTLIHYAAAALCYNLCGYDAVWA